ncbi:MAG: glycosyltransferase family 4 protein [bacterium]
MRTVVDGEFRKPDMLLIKRLGSIEMPVIFHGVPRIACVDLTFNWSPVGGCWVDTYHVLKGLQSRGAKVHLFMPDFQRYYPRGKVEGDLPFPHSKIEFNRFTFNFSSVIRRFREQVENFKPDLIFLTDGYFMKNHLMTAFNPQRCISRFYSYELLCINLHHHRYHEQRNCDTNFLENPAECHRCWFQRMPAAGRAFQIALGMKEKHPRLHFSQEYLASLAFTEAYREKLRENLSNLRGAIVYNDIMKGMLARVTPNIYKIPSGVDSRVFTPGTGTANSEKPIRIFLPGRANDPLKGMQVLIDACEHLAAEQVSFEVHYTAAMDCPSDQPWLINRGWVPPEHLPDLYREMDIVVVPSTWVEPFGITALEGMAGALPVVASNIGGLAETVVDGVTGYHFEAGNAEQLAQCLIRLIRNPELRKQMGQEGRLRVEEQYDWDVILDTIYMPLVEQWMMELSNSSRTEYQKISIAS